MKYLLIIIILTFTFFSCNNEKDNNMNLDLTAEEFIKICLAWGNFDEDYVDAYYGPEKFKFEAKEMDLKIEDFEKECNALIDKINSIKLDETNKLEELRKNYQISTLNALKTRVRILNGEKISFDEECLGIFGVIPDKYDEEYFVAIIKEIDELLPGEGSLNQRMSDFRSGFRVDEDKLDLLFERALEESKRVSIEQLDLPLRETFTISYVKNKPWSGYNWYKGNYHSEIEINTDLPIYIDRVIDLAAHEGYPGHHVFHSNYEKILIHQYGFQEFTIYPLFSPLSLLSEGSANYGIDLVFPLEKRIDFEKRVLFPLADLDTNVYDKYLKINQLTSKLSYAGNNAAERYINKEISKEEAIEYIMKYNLFSKEQAEKRINFIDAYRSYVITYNFGLDLVRNFIKEKAGENYERRWLIFSDLISHPYLPTDLKD